MTAAKPVSAVVTYHNLDGQPVRVFEDPVEAQESVDKMQGGACCTDVVRATSFRSAQRISQILKQNLFRKGQDRVGTRVRGYTTSYEGFVVEAGGLYSGFVSIGWVLPHEVGRHRSNGEACEAYNRAYGNMAHCLTKNGFKVVTVPARPNAYGLSTGGVWVIGKEEA